MTRGKSKIPARAAAIRLASLAVVLTAWELYGRSVNPILFTYPTAIAQAFAELVASGELQHYLLQSLQVLALSLLFSILVGIPLGVLIGRSTTVELATDLYINALYATPMVALVPLVVLWFGFGLVAKVVIVFLFMLFPILINTQQGVKSVDRGLLEVARAFCSTERQLWADVILPSALPFITAGLRLAIGRGLVGMVVAEFYTSIAGLGYMIVRYANAFETAKLFVPIVVLMAMGVLLVHGAKVLELRLAPWRRRGEGEA
ncbi:MAG TPA: ABC transporter permease [Thermodesulfobacteriota bacterium]|nr:ABC transporter permease [Thermodesulfobacteriota bacterium]